MNISTCMRGTWIFPNENLWTLFFKCENNRPPCIDGCTRNDSVVYRRCNEWERDLWIRRKWNRNFRGNTQNRSFLIWWRKKNDFFHFFGAEQFSVSCGCGRNHIFYPLRGFNSFMKRFVLNRFVTSSYFSGYQRIRQWNKKVFAFDYVEIAWRSLRLQIHITVLFKEIMKNIAAHARFVIIRITFWYLLYAHDFLSRMLASASTHFLTQFNFKATFHLAHFKRIWISLFLSSPSPSARTIFVINLMCHFELSRIAVNTKINKAGEQKKKKN